MVTVNQPPGPEGGILGLQFVNSFKEDALGTAMRLKQEFGDIVYVKAANTHWFMFNHPDQVKDILLTRAKMFGKTDIFKRVLSRVDGNGLVVSEGEFWLRQRRIINPAFSHLSIDIYEKTMREETERYISEWESGMTLDLAEEMTKLTLTIAARVFFSADVRDNAQELGDAVTVISQAMLHEFYEIIPVPEWIPLPSKIAKKNAIARLDKLIADSISSHRSNPPARPDVLSMLLQARDTKGDQELMPEKQIRDEAMTMFNAGHDSTAAALSWAWYLLLKNPDEYNRFLRSQERKALALQVSKEALRLYPPAWTLPRQALADTEIGGYSVPEGSLLNFFPYVMHRDERFFESPEEFKPQRFAPGYEEELHPFTYFPFGAGPRACIGKEMALTEMSVLLSLITDKFKFELAPGQDNIAPVPLVSLEQKKGVKAIVHRR
ncbi:MAG: cytochrome P450 [Candidatus Obscuribacterales bacterium]|nr:cytochrome P450 [Candidatus Obscuribacterales bacterium]